MWSATRSACATIVSAGFTAADEGKNDASTTNRFSTSCARQNGSSTDARGSVPNTSVPHWCVVFFAPCECAKTRGDQKPSRAQDPPQLVDQLARARARLFGR